MSSNRFRLFKIESGKMLGRKIFNAENTDKRDKIIQRVLKSKNGEQKLRDAMNYLERHAAYTLTGSRQSIQSIEQALPSNEPTHNDIYQTIIL